MKDEEQAELTEIRDLRQRLAALESERDYYRQEAGRLGHKSPTGPQDFINIIQRLKDTEKGLLTSKNELEQLVAERTAELVRANKELCENEEKCRALFENASVGIFVHDSETGQILLANRRALERNAVTSLEELREKDIWLPAPYSREDALCWIRRAATEGPQQFEWKDIDVRGNIFWCDVSLTTIVLDGIPRIAAFAQDITARKRAEMAVRESEQKYRAVIENIGIGIAIISPEMKILSLNRKMQEWFPDICLDLREYVCYTAFNAPPRDHICDYCPVALTFRDGMVREAVTETPAGDSIINYRIVSSPLRDEAGRVIAVIEMVENITERIRAENAVRMSEKTYRSIIDSFREAVYVLDDNGNFIDVNKGAERMYGYTRDELIGRSPVQVSAPGKNDMLWVVQQCRLAFDGEPREIEFWGQAKDGHIFPKEVHLYPGEYFGRKALVAIAQDITERRQMEDTLRASEEMYRLLTQLSPSSISVADSSGALRMLNARATELFGHENESEVLGRNIFDWVCNDDRERAMHAFQETLTSGSIMSLELRLRRKNGMEFPAEVNASLLHGTQGAPNLVLIVTTDLTHRKQIEEEYLKTQKLEAVGILAGGIAHDFNNLLQGIFGYISIAKLKLDNKEKARALLEQAEKALDMSVNLTSQLLTFAKGGRPSKKKMTLKPVIENASRFALSGSRTDCRLAMPSDLWLVDADEGQIGQVIQNIVMNAGESMPQGGTVEIEVRNLQLAQGDNSALPGGGRFVVISISDRGIGIPEHFISKIFDPYFTTKQKGSGLGLATSYSIVKNHGGIIDVASESQKGTVFSIYLPAADPEEVKVQVPAQEAVCRRRVLVMDDEEMVRNVAGELINMLGHETDCAVDGEEAIEKYRHAKLQGRPYDVVIFDLTVKGGMGGEEAVGKLLKLDPEAVVVVSSGYADNPVMADYRSYGFIASLNKPYKIDALRGCLNRLLK